MKTKMSIIIVFVVMIINVVVMVPESEGVDWVNYYSEDDSIMYYDKDSIIQVSENVIRVWTKWKWSEGGEVDGFKFTAISALVEINCHLRELRYLNVFYCLDIGIYYKGIDSLYHTYPTEWKSMIPGSLNEILFKNVYRK